MTESRERHEVRIRVTGTHDGSQDLEDLQRWLQRESWLTPGNHRWRRVPGAGTAAPHAADQGPEMAVGVDDLVLVLIGAVAAPMTEQLLIALREWLAHRRETAAPGEEPALDLTDAAGHRRLDDPDPRTERDDQGGRVGTE
ncbi:hypothetical protein C3486_29795 [Streptomyces sp. Ru73]|uniref:hypothetical protein n=1 Tax=Streptomyces sp. Ru73 TaxID=2080748 RepID=UPI000CDE055A|nr:hypothetical protein [Streptomyces sp. Ru73]POX37172.1 hypothetical protein C3486_29795 [Streptomyces sp. Ru73]